MQPNHYDILGLNPNGLNSSGEPYSKNEIKDAYKKKSRETHPDRRLYDPRAHQKFQQVNHSYKILSNSETRAHFDNYLKKNPDAFDNKHLFVNIGTDSTNLTKLIMNAGYNGEGLLRFANDNHLFALALLDNPCTFNTLTLVDQFELLIIIQQQLDDKFDDILKKTTVKYLRNQLIAQNVEYESAFSNVCVQHKKHADQIPTLFLDILPKLDSQTLLRLSQHFYNIVPILIKKYCLEIPDIQFILQHHPSHKKDIYTLLKKEMNERKYESFETYETYKENIGKGDDVALITSFILEEDKVAYDLKKFGVNAFSLITYFSSEKMPILIENDKSNITILNMLIANGENIGDFMMHCIFNMLIARENVNQFKKLYSSEHDLNVFLKKFLFILCQINLERINCREKNIENREIYFHNYEVIDYLLNQFDYDQFSFFIKIFDLNILKNQHNFDFVEFVLNKGKSNQEEPWLLLLLKENNKSAWKTLKKNTLLLEALVNNTDYQEALGKHPDIQAKLAGLTIKHKAKIDETLPRVGYFYHFYESRDAFSKFYSYIKPENPSDKCAITNKEFKSLYEITGFFKDVSDIYTHDNEVKMIVLIDGLIKSENKERRFKLLDRLVDLYLKSDETNQKSLLENCRSPTILKNIIEKIRETAKEVRNLHNASRDDRELVIFFQLINLLGKIDIEGNHLTSGLIYQLNLIFKLGVSAPFSDCFLELQTSERFKNKLLCYHDLIRTLNSIKNVSTSSRMLPDKNNDLDQLYQSILKTKIDVETLELLEVQLKDSHPELLSGLLLLILEDQSFRFPEELRKKIITLQINLPLTQPLELTFLKLAEQYLHKYRNTIDTPTLIKIVEAHDEKIDSCIRNCGLYNRLLVAKKFEEEFAKIGKATKKDFTQKERSKEQIEQELYNEFYHLISRFSDPNNVVDPNEAKLYHAELVQTLETYGIDTDRIKMLLESFPHEDEDNLLLWMIALALRGDALSLEELKKLLTHADEKNAKIIYRSVLEYLATTKDELSVVEPYLGQEFVGEVLTLKKQIEQELYDKFDHLIGRFSDANNMVKLNETKAYYDELVQVSKRYGIDSVRIKMLLENFPHEAEDNLLLWMIALASQGDDLALEALKKLLDCNDKDIIYLNFLQYIKTTKNEDPLSVANTHLDQNFVREALNRFYKKLQCPPSPLFSLNEEPSHAIFNYLKKEFPQERASEVQNSSINPRNPLHILCYFELIPEEEIDSVDPNTLLFQAYKELAKNLLEKKIINQEQISHIRDFFNSSFYKFFKKRILDELESKKNPVLIDEINDAEEKTVLLIIQKTLLTKLIECTGILQLTDLRKDCYSNTEDMNNRLEIAVYEAINQEIIDQFNKQEKETIKATLKGILGILMGINPEIQPLEIRHPSDYSKAILSGKTGIETIEFSKIEEARLKREYFKHYQEDILTNLANDIEGLQSQKKLYKEELSDKKLSEYIKSKIRDYKDKAAPLKKDKIEYDHQLLQFEKAIEEDKYLQSIFNRYPHPAHEAIAKLRCLKNLSEEQVDSLIKQLVNDYDAKIAVIKMNFANSRIDLSFYIPDDTPGLIEKNPAKMQRIINQINFLEKEKQAHENWKQEWLSAHYKNKKIFEQLSAFENEIKLMQRNSKDENSQCRITADMLKAFNSLYSKIKEELFSHEECKIVKTPYPVVIDHFTQIAKEINSGKRHSKEDVMKSERLINKRLKNKKPMSKELKMCIFGVIGAIVGGIIGFAIGAAFTFWAGGFASLPVAIYCGMAGCTLAQGFALSAGALAGSLGAGATSAKAGFFIGKSKQTLYDQKQRDKKSIEKEINDVNLQLNPQAAV